MLKSIAMRYDVQARRRREGGKARSLCFGYRVYQIARFTGQHLGVRTRGVRNWRIDTIIDRRRSIEPLQQIEIRSKVQDYRAADSGALQCFHRSLVCCTEARVDVVPRKQFRSQHI